MAESVRRYLKCLGAAAVILTLAGRVAAGGPERQAFELGPLRVAPGEAASGYLEVPDKDGQAAFIPVTVLHGLRPGPVLALVAGVHGSEYPPILALYRLKHMIDPKKLAGTAVLVHVANIPSFQKRTIYYTPQDGKNLNRVFPGDPQGTLSQRIAFILTRDVVDRCDVLVDMHCGDANEDLLPYSYWMISGREDLDRRTRELALAFGLKHIIIDTTRPKDPADSKFLGNTAILRNKPAITTEAGLLGGTEEEYISLNVQGALNVLRHLGMMEGTVEALTDPVWIDRYEVVNSQVNGLFHPLTHRGHWVQKGQRVGFITDFLGHQVEDIQAPFSGIVLYIIATPPTSQGEPLFEVGRVKE
ncbi:MAG: M14 family metallopeptidase [Candidatus Aminicenantales bacterium]